MTMKFIWLIKSAFALQREHVSFHSQTEMTQTENVVVTSALFRVFQNFFSWSCISSLPKKTDSTRIWQKLSRSSCSHGGHGTSKHLAVLWVSGAARMRPKRSCPTPPKTNLLRFLLVLYINLQLLVNKQSDSRWRQWRDRPEHNSWLRYCCRLCYSWGSIFFILLFQNATNTGVARWTLRGHAPSNI